MPSVRSQPSHRLSVAPMMDYTDRHDRYFLRLISRHALLYSEMLTTAALLRGDRSGLLAFNEEEHPVALQLGGSEPVDMARCARFGEEQGYDEINMNVGCPSDRVQTGRFGACLMAEPGQVAECVAAMQAAVSIPVTVKTRIGIDTQDAYGDLHNFIDTVARSGCGSFAVHARKAWLKGLSPKQNREVPPLRYDVVHRLKQDFPTLDIVLNGGIRSLDEAAHHLQSVDGVMIGREAYHNPYLLADVDRRFFGATAAPLSRHEVVERMLEYMSRELATGSMLVQMSRHMLGLFHAVPGARAWRRYLSENVYKPGAGTEVITDALRKIQLHSLDQQQQQYTGAVDGSIR